MAALFGTIGLFIVPETSAQRILQIRAKRLRYETKNWALHAKADENQITLHTIVHVYLKRPWVMIVQEPILALMTAYMSYLYGVIYLLFEAFPISFHEERGWSLGVSALPFVSFIFGIGMGTGMMIYSTATNFKRSYIKHGKPIPEERLPPMIVGAIMLPIAFFWFAWTSFPSITWVPQVISVAFIGAGILVAFWQGMNYIIDCYGVSPVQHTAYTGTEADLYSALLVLQQLGHRGQHFHPQHRGCRFPTLRADHVPPPWCPLGDLSARLPVSGFPAGANPVLPVRREDSREVQVHTHWLKGIDRLEFCMLAA